MRGEQGENGGAKARLLDAAELFAQSPYTEVGVAAILKIAAVQAPTLYHHFGDKEGLFVAWAVGAVERLGADIQATRSKGSQLSDVLAGIAGCLADPRHPDVTQLIQDSEKLSRAESREAVIGAVHRAVYESLIVGFLPGIESGALKRDPARKAVAAFLSSVRSLRPKGLLPLSEDPGHLDWVVDRFLNGFANAKPTG